MDTPRRHWVRVNRNVPNCKPGRLRAGRFATEEPRSELCGGTSGVHGHTKSGSMLARREVATVLRSSGTAKVEGQGRAWASSLPLQTTALAVSELHSCTNCIPVKNIGRICACVTIHTCDAKLLCTPCRSAQPTSLPKGSKHQRICGRPTTNSKRNSSK